MHRFAQDKLRSIIQKVNKEDLGVWINAKRVGTLLNTIFAMITAKSVSSSDLGLHLNPNATVESNIRTLERFWAELNLDPLFVAIVILNLIPVNKYKLCLDRTNWKAAGFEANYLVLALRFKNTAIPLMVLAITNKEGISHRGNSNTDARKCLLKRFTDHFGTDCIDCIIADREFIGQKWFAYLADIPFCIRIKQDTLVKLSDGSWCNAWALIAEQKEYTGKVYLDGLWLNLSGKWIEQEGKAEALLVVSNVYSGTNLLAIYRKRWAIEVCFQGLKSSGFNIENSKLSSIERLESLFLVASLAYSVCLSVGIYQQKKSKNNRSKGKKYKSNSYARRGIDLIQQAFKGYKQAIEYLKQWLDLVSNAFFHT
jgi:Transposase DDE domain